jgi:hypothetical protein
MEISSSFPSSFIASGRTLTSSLCCSAFQIGQCFFLRISQKGQAWLDGMLASQSCSAACILTYPLRISCVIVLIEEMIC